MSEDPTHRVIENMIREMHSADAGQLAAMTGLSKAAIRYHLGRMAAAGEIEACPSEIGSKPGKGRPARQYRLPVAQSPNNLAGLCLALLHTAKGGKVDWDGLAREIAAPLPAARQVVQRLAEAVERLNQMQYRASWEAGPNGPRIRLGHCPYAAIWSQVPDICRLDQALVSKLVQTAARQTMRMSFTKEHPTTCIFETGELRIR